MKYWDIGVSTRRYEKWSKREDKLLKKNDKLIPTKIQEAFNSKGYKRTVAALVERRKKL